MAQKSLLCLLGIFCCVILIDISNNMSSSNPIEWEKLLKHGICSNCGATLDFDDTCQDCTGGADYIISAWGT